MIGSGLLRVTLSALILSGCASTGVLCEKSDQTMHSFGDVTMSAPEGCRFMGDAGGPVQSIICDDGRQGLTIADVSEISSGANK